MAELLVCAREKSICGEQNDNHRLTAARALVTHCYSVTTALICQRRREREAVRDSVRENKQHYSISAVQFVTATTHYRSMWHASVLLRRFVRRSQTGQLTRSYAPDSFLTPALGLVLAYLLIIS